MADHRTGGTPHLRRRSIADAPLPHGPTFREWPQQTVEPSGTGPFLRDQRKERMNGFNIQDIIFTAIAVFLVLPVHEFAHAWTARRFGDDTAERLGRLTLNPFRHLDPFGTIMMFVAGFGWAKPVPINPNNFRKPRLGLFVTSAAGPLSNLLMAFFSVFFTGAIFRMYTGSFAETASTFTIDIFQTFVDMFGMMAYINLVLAVFNLIPVPPLDGSRLLTVLLPTGMQKWLGRIEQIVGLAFIAVAIVIPAITGQSGIVGRFLNAVVQPLYEGMWKVVALIFGLDI